MNQNYLAQASMGPRCSCEVECADGLEQAWEELLVQLAVANAPPHPLTASFGLALTFVQFLQLKLLL